MIGRIPSRIQSVPARVAIESEAFLNHCTKFHFVEPMATTTRVLRSYDHRLRELVHTTGDSSLALRIGVPRSTACGWMKRRPKSVLSIKAHDAISECLEREIIRLRAKVTKLRCLFRLAFLVLKISGFKLKSCRIPDSVTKQQLIKAVDKASVSIPLRSILAVIGLSHSRYHAWTKEKECELTDLPTLSPYMWFGATCSQAT